MSYPEDPTLQPPSDPYGQPPVYGVQPAYGEQPAYEQQIPFPEQPSQPFPNQPYPTQPLPGQQFPGPQFPGPQFPSQQFPAQPYATGPYGPPMMPMQPKKSRAGLIIGIVAVVLVLCAGGIVAAVLASSDKTAGNTAGSNTTGSNTTGNTTAGTTPTTAPAKSGNTQDLKIGRTITVTDDANSWDVTVNSVTYRTTGCDTGDAGFSDPDSGDAYVLVEVTYKVNSGVGSYNPLDWTVVDSSGNEYDPALFADCKPELDSGNSLHGLRHGIVAIEVKAGVRHGQVDYSAGLFDDNGSSWDF